MAQFLVTIDTADKKYYFSQPLDIAGLVDYQRVRRTITATPHVNITLFACDQGEELSAHTSPGDAMVQVLDGSTRITIEGIENGHPEKTLARLDQAIVIQTEYPIYYLKRGEILYPVV